MMTAKMSWQGGLKFEGTGVFGHKIITDGGKAAGGEESGYKPTELLLFGIASCTGIDVVRILEKMRQKVKNIEIEVVAQQPDDFPKPFHKIAVNYTVHGDNLNEAKVAQAIELSESKYCTVSQTCSMNSEITTNLTIIQSK